MSSTALAVAADDSGSEPLGEKEDGCHPRRPSFIPLCPQVATRAQAVKQKSSEKSRHSVARLARGGAIDLAPWGDGRGLLGGDVGVQGKGERGPAAGSSAWTGIGVQIPIF